jgi:hypothetical protein
MTIAVPVSWHIGNTPPAAILVKYQQQEIKFEMIDKIYRVIRMQRDGLIYDIDI